MEEFFDRHSVALVKHELLYPLYKMWTTGRIVGSLAAGTITGTITGDPVAGIASSVATKEADALIQLGIDKIKAIKHPLKKFGFNPEDYLLFTGYKKDYEGNLVTRKFDPITKVPDAKPEVGENSKLVADLFQGALTKFDHQRVYSQEYFNDYIDEFTTAMQEKDIFCSGGPIPIDLLRKVMEGRDCLPCNYKLTNFEDKDIHSEDETGIDKKLPKYPIIIEKENRLLYPEWNKLDWGIITCVDKELIFSENYSKTKGIFLNVSGCHGFGTLGAGRLIIENASYLAQYVKEKLNTNRNFQAIVKVTIGPSKKISSYYKLIDAFKVR